MLREDPRSYLIAMIPDAIVNPLSELYRGLSLDYSAFDAIADAGYGAMTLPSYAVAPSEAYGIGVRQACDDCVDYQNKGYRIVLISLAGLDDGGVWRSVINEQFATWGAQPPSEFAFDGDVAALTDFLASEAARPRTVKAPIR